MYLCIFIRNILRWYFDIFNKNALTVKINTFQFGGRLSVTVRHANCEIWCEIILRVFDAMRRGSIRWTVGRGTRSSRLDTHKSYANMYSTGNNKGNGSAEKKRRRRREERCSGIPGGGWCGLVWDSNENKSNEIIWFITITITISWLQTLLYMSLPQGMNACARDFFIIFLFLIFFLSRQFRMRWIHLVLASVCVCVCVLPWLLPILFRLRIRNETVSRIFDFERCKVRAFIFLARTQPRWLFFFFSHSLLPVRQQYSNNNNGVTPFFSTRIYIFFVCQRAKIVLWDFDIAMEKRRKKSRFNRSKSVLWFIVSERREDEKM